MPGSLSNILLRYAAEIINVIILQITLHLAEQEKSVALHFTEAYLVISVELVRSIFDFAMQNEMSIEMFEEKILNVQCSEKGQIKFTSTLQ